jgi:hypothetical protein
MLSRVPLITTLGQKKKSIVAIGETLLSCCLCGEIMVRWHDELVAMM